MAIKIKSFAFLVVARNHEKYIIEHLESIKFLVENYAADLKVELIINDDFSSDSTVPLVLRWLEINGYLFERVVKIFNKENIGTCSSIVNMIRELKSDACKLTAGDDVYSYENIFNYAVLDDDLAIRSGMPLHLVDNEIFLNKSDVFNIISCDNIYSKNKLSSRFKGVGVINTPNLIYSIDILKDERILNFIDEFDLVEDRAIWLSASKYLPDKKFELQEKVFVYYRRTPGSAYITENPRVFKDNSKFHDYLMSNSSSIIEKIMLQNKFFCYSLKKPLLRRALNISLYIYFFKVLACFSKCLKRYIEFDACIDKHKLHYSKISKAADVFYSKSV